MENGQSLQQKMLRKLDIHIPKNEANIVYKNYHKINLRLSELSKIIFFLIVQCVRNCEEAQIVVVFSQPLSCVWLFVTQWTAARQASLSCFLEFAQTHVHWVADAVQPSHPLLSPSPSALSLSQHHVFSSESALHFRWPKYWSFSTSPSSEYSGLISFRIN